MVCQRDGEELPPKGRPLVGRSPATKEVRGTLLALLRKLEEGLPLPHKVLLRVVRLKDCYGTCELRDTARDGRHFLINISPPETVTYESLYVCQETLLHEYAHALSWNMASTEGGHGEGWGCAYAAIYRLIHGD